MGSKGVIPARSRSLSSLADFSSPSSSRSPLSCSPWSNLSALYPQLATVHVLTGTVLLNAPDIWSSTPPIYIICTYFTRERSSPLLSLTIDGSSNLFFLFLSTSVANGDETVTSLPYFYCLKARNINREFLIESWRKTKESLIFLKFDRVLNLSKQNKRKIMSSQNAKSPLLNGCSIKKVAPLKRSDRVEKRSGPHPIGIEPLRNRCLVIIQP